MPDSWLAITVAVGDSNYRKAATRITSQLKDTGLFDRIEIVTEIEIYAFLNSDSVGRILDFFQPDELVSEKKFGYCFWQPTALLMATQGFWGDFDGVLYLDAGCEVLPGPLSQMYLRYQMKRAKTEGWITFSINTPEECYTKKFVTDLFQIDKGQLAAPQFQTGTIFCFGSRAKTIASLWMECVSLDRKMIDETFDNESEIFVAHRHAQSVLSCLLKKIGISEGCWKPGGLKTKLTSQLLNAFRGIWWSRNISATSVLNPGLRILLSPASELNRFITRSKKLNVK